jgi:diaminohydroxyphosphoribosylaminopyrimidine deaminase / 5-amino-6-(5-phosphoribosylamino)uracil reductase
MKVSQLNSHYMSYAFRLGRRALGTTAENPAVGCVIVKDDRILGVGCTQPGGRPHAEVMALAMAGAEAKAATAYVTLEPCSHHGRTAPCADALIKAGIAKVVIAIEDPDPRVAGQGVSMLRAAGIEVVVGEGEAQARAAHAGFFSRIMRKRPYVTLKFAVSADHKIASTPGQRTTITGEQVNARVHLMRAQSDAILVGMGTVMSDDPELTCRLPGMEQRSPKAFVLARGPLPPESKLAKLGATLLILPIRHSGEGRNLSSEWVPAFAGMTLKEHLEALASQGINTLMIEGGAKTARLFLEAGLVDEFHIFAAPITLGANAVDALAGFSLSEALKHFHHISEETLGADHLNVYGKT